MRPSESESTSTDESAPPRAEGPDTGEKGGEGIGSPGRRSAHAPPSAFLSATAVSFTRGLQLLLTLASGMLTAAYFGASVSKDCYLVAQTLPLLLQTILMSGVYGLVLVALADVGPTEGVSGQFRLVRTTLLQLALVLTPLCLVGTLFPRPIIALIAPGFSRDRIELSGRLLAFTLFTVMGTVGFAVFRALCNARHHFAMPGFINLIVSVTSILILVLLVERAGIFALALGQLVGTILALAALALTASLVLKDPPGFAPQSSGAARGEGRSVWRDFLPMSIGANFGQVNLLVDNAFASYLATGTITQLGFATVIFSNAEYLTIFSLAEVAFARFAAADRRGGEALEDELRLNLRYMLLLAAPIAAGCLGFGTPLARTLFERGEFGPDSTSAVARILACLAPEIVFMGYFACFWRLLFARRRLLSLVWTSVGAMALNGALNAVLMRPLGISGIALATSCVTAMFSVILGLLVRREGLRIFGPGDLLYALRVILGAAFMGGVVFVWSVAFERTFDVRMEPVRLAEVAGGLILGALSYALALQAQGIRAVPEAFQRLRTMPFLRRRA